MLAEYLRYWVTQSNKRKNQERKIPARPTKMGQAPHEAEGEPSREAEGEPDTLSPLGASRRSEAASGTEK